VFVITKYNTFYRFDFNIITVFQTGNNFNLNFQKTTTVIIIKLNFLYHFWNNRRLRSVYTERDRGLAAFAKEWSK